MRRVFLHLSLLLAAAATSAQVEGVAEFRVVTGGGQKGNPIALTGTMFFNRSAYRMESTMGPPAGTRPGKDGEKTAPPRQIKVTMLIQAAEPDKVTMINDENKTYSVWDMKKIRDESAARAKDTYSVEKLGKDQVAGMSCQNMRVTSARGLEVELCLTRDLPASTDWLSLINRKAPDSAAWLKTLRDRGVEGFPVRYVIGRKGDMTKAVTMELTHFEKKSLPASLFVVPPGYKETGMALGGLTPEQEKAMESAREQMKGALANMTPEQRKQYEDAMKKYAPTPRP